MTVSKGRKTRAVCQRGTHLLPRPLIDSLRRIDKAYKETSIDRSHCQILHHLSRAQRCRTSPSYHPTQMPSRTTYSPKKYSSILPLHHRRGRMRWRHFKEAENSNGEHQEGFHLIKYRNTLELLPTGSLSYPLLSIRPFQIEVNIFGSQGK